MSRSPASLVELAVGFVSKAEVVASRSRNGLRHVGDLADDREIVLLRLVVDGSIAREGADQIVIHARCQSPIHAGEFNIGGNGGVTILANETQRLDRGADETGDLLGLLLDKAVGRRQCSPGIFHLASKKEKLSHPGIDADIAWLN